MFQIYLGLGLLVESYGQTMNYATVGTSLTGAHWYRA